MYFGLDLQGAVLHLEHERHDFRVGGLGQPQSVHSGVIVHITKILQQIEGETLALQCAFAKLADERLLVASSQTRSAALRMRCANGGRLSRWMPLAASNS